MAAPPTINLLREIILISSVISISISYIILLAIIRFFTAAYSLYMYTTIHHGSARSISNPIPATKQKEFSLILIHLTPIVLIITKPELITSWN
jgi:NADH-ubiquinone oxidoreductase chain 4